jgi:hypothetical protein
VRIATFNVSGVNDRLASILRWLAEDKPDVVCLQDLKAAEKQFPQAAFADLGYAAVWHGQSRRNGVAILSRGPLLERRRGLPGDPGDPHSRYIEAAVGDLVIGCANAPEGHPAPGSAFSYKLKWLGRLQRQRTWTPLRRSGGEATRRFGQRQGPHIVGCFSKAGRMRFAKSIRTERPIRFGVIGAASWRTMMGFASTTCCSAPT